MLHERCLTRQYAATSNKWLYGVDPLEAGSARKGIASPSQQMLQTLKKFEG